MCIIQTSETKRLSQLCTDSGGFWLYSADVIIEDLGGCTSLSEACPYCYVVQAKRGEPAHIVLCLALPPFLFPRSEQNKESGQCEVFIYIHFLRRQPAMLACRRGKNNSDHGTPGTQRGCVIECLGMS